MMNSDKNKKVTKYEINKLTFLDEVYDNPATKEIYYDIWERCIKYFEINNEKDLYQFTSDEIEGIIQTIPTISSSRKANAFTFMSIYCEWAVSKGKININPCSVIDREKISKINHKALKKKLLSLDEVYELCQNLSSYGTIFDWLPILMARYGIMGNDLEWMRFLKWEHIDHINKKVLIVNDYGELLSEIDVDDRFLEVIKKAKDTDYQEEMASERVFNKSAKKYYSNKVMKEIRFIDNGYVLKKRENAVTEEPYVLESVLYTNIRRLCIEANVDRPSYKNLSKARRIELLLEIRKKRKLTNNDVKSVLSIFNPTISGGGYISLKRDYESLTKDKVFLVDTPEEDLIDDNAEEFVTKIKYEVFGE